MNDDKWESLKLDYEAEQRERNRPMKTYLVWREVHECIEVRAESEDAAIEAANEIDAGEWEVQVTAVDVQEVGK